MTKDQLKEYANNIDKQLKAQDFNCLITVKHGDGSVFSLHNAKIDVHSMETHIIVFTEHHGYFIWDLEDLKKYTVTPY